LFLFYWLKFKAIFNYLALKGGLLEPSEHPVEPNERPLEPSERPLEPSERPLRQSKRLIESSGCSNTLNLLGFCIIISLSQLQIIQKPLRF